MIGDLSGMTNHWWKFAGLKPLIALPLGWYEKNKIYLVLKDEA